MKLDFKPDFEEARQRWTAFWKGENTRPLVSIIVPKPGTKYRGPNKHLAGLPWETPLTPTGLPGEPPPYLAGLDGNFQPVIEQLLAWGEAYDFIGEAIPGYYLEFGPDTFAANLGAELHYDEDSQSNWCIPFVENWDAVEIRFQREGHWWQLTQAFIRAVRAQCDGKLLIVPPTLVGNLDALAAIRGAANLFVDMMEEPGKIKRALDAVCRAHTEIINAYAEELAWDEWGSLNIEATYTTGRHSRPQCDAACMISSDMFREFVLPCLEYEANEQAAFVFHLDGPGALHHVEALCRMDRLDVIAFMPGTGNEDKDWSELATKIDRLGKGHLFASTKTSHAEIKAAWQKYKSRKLFFCAEAASRMEAEDFIAKLEKLEK